MIHLYFSYSECLRCQANAAIDASYFNFLSLLHLNSRFPISPLLVMSGFISRRNGKYSRNVHLLVGQTLHQVGLQAHLPWSNSYFGLVSRRKEDPCRTLLFR